MLKADPTKSNRQVAKLRGTSHPHVAKVRERAETAGDVETVTTSVDTKGREQPVKRKTKPTEADLEAWAAGDISRVEAAKRGIAEAREQPATQPTPLSRADIGANATSEVARLQARIEELEAAVRLRDVKIAELQSEVDRLKAHIRDLENAAPAADDGGPSPTVWGGPHHERGRAPAQLCAVPVARRSAIHGRSDRGGGDE